MQKTHTEKSRAFFVEVDCCFLYTIRKGKTFIPFSYTYREMKKE